MIVPVLLTVLAAGTFAQCQTTTETVVDCTTSYSPTALPPGSALRTASFVTTYGYNTTITSTSLETITVTPSSTVFTDVVNVTSTTTTTVTSVPAATTIAAPAGFFPLINTGRALAGPTATALAIGRHRRASVETREQHLERIKRLDRTPDGNTSGYIVLPNGVGQSLANEFPAYVECQVRVNVNITTTEVVTGPIQTEIAAPATATAVSTSTIVTTETVLETAAQPTEYAACQANNVVNNVTGFNNEPIFFDRIVFANPVGIPLTNTLVVNTTDPTNCCVACQLTPFCAGSFFVPSIGVCHLQLTQAAPVSSSVPSLPSATLLPPFPLPSSNTSLPYPTASGAPYPAGNDTVILPTGTALLGTGVPTLVPVATPISDGGMSILPVVETPTPGTISAPGAGTCSAGSLSFYLGRVYGQSNFPADVAMYFSNGPCGRISVGFDEAPPVRQEDLTPTVQRRWIGSSLL